MSTDLTTVYDHPANVIGEWLADLPTPHAERPGGIRAAEVLRAHERENNVTFAALDNATLAAVKETYEAGESATGLVDVSTAHSVLRSVVADLLGLDDQ